MANSIHAQARLRSLIGKAVHHQQRGEYPEAERIYREVLTEDPDQADAHNLLGLLAHQTARDELAESHMRRSIGLAPKRADFHYNYGAMLAETGKPDLAAREFQAAVELSPEMADAWQGLATAFRAMKLDMYAAACLQRLIRLQPRRADLWQNLGECFVSLSMLPEARDAYRQAQQLAPQDAAIQLALAGIAVDSGDDVSARAALDRLLSMAPDMPEAHYQHGVWLANRGDFDPARTALERALHLAPDFYQAALFYAYITPLALDSPLVQRLSQVAQQTVWKEPGQGSNVHFALGYVLDKDGQYEAAFEHYLEANRLQRELKRYTTDSHRQFQRSILDAFGPAFQARARNFANASEKPLFIVGLPRSGTSLLEQILSSHPAVHGGGEMLYLHSELRRRLGPAGHGDFSRSIVALHDSALAELGNGMLAHMDALAPGKLRVTDKMPSNLTILGLIHALFPNARIVYCQRDPLDTCVSCFTTSFKSGHKFSNDLRELGEYYRLNEAAMTQWQAMFPAGTIHTIRYEDLVTDMEAQVRKLLAFCGLEWDEGCLNYQKNSRAVSTASVYQVRQPIYSSAIGRWRRYAAHLGPLQQALAAPPLL